MTNLIEELQQRQAAVRHDVSILRPYQTDELLPILRENPYWGMFVDMGLGKTATMLTAIEEWLVTGEVHKVLIVAPLRVAVQTWPTEIREWSHTWWMSYTVIRADLKDPGLIRAQKMARSLERDKMLGSPITAAQEARKAHIEQQKQRLAMQPTLIHIINREALDWLMRFHQKNGRKWPYDCVVVDESRNYADHKTTRWKALNTIRPVTKRMYLLSGVPAPEGITDYFAQIFLLDRGKRLGNNITAFRDRYLRYDKYEQKYYPLKGAEEEVAQQIADISVIMRTEDHLNRDPYIVIERPVILERDELKRYKDFEKTMIMTVDDEEIEAVNGADLSNKLLQAASGAIYDKDKKFHILHEHKMEELKEIREEAHGEPLLIAYWHQSTLARMRQLLPDAVVMDREGSCVDAWNKGKIPELLIHPRAAGHGLNMQLGPGHILVWVDNPLPLDDYLQTIKRLDRPGQKKIVKVFHLVTQNTVDTRVVPVLRNKDDAQDTVRKYIRDLRREWRKL